MDYLEEPVTVAASPNHLAAAITALSNPLMTHPSAATPGYKAEIEATLRP
jgi:hypothetical protein